MIGIEVAAATIRLTVPLLLAALGEMWVQRAGLINVSIEGAMLIGAFAGVAVSHLTESALLGLVAALVASTFFCLLFGLFTIRLRVNPILVGTALNLIALGLTGFLYRSLFGATGRTMIVPPLRSLAPESLRELPVAGPLLFDHTPLVPLAFVLVPVMAYILYETRTGLMVRAAGENPEALEAAGLSVNSVRFQAVLVEGVLAGAAGAYLSLAHAHTFIEGMTAGRGFLALAIVFSARCIPLRVLAISLLFGSTLAVQFQLQASGTSVPHQLIHMLPYVLTLVVLACFGRPSGRETWKLGS